MGTLYEDHCIFGHILFSLLRMRNVPDKSCGESKYTFCFK